MSPPLKWAGGKRWMLPALRAVYDCYRDRRLVEPFVGGMAVALGLQPSEAWLNDVNPHLVNFYGRLRDARPFTIDMRNDPLLYYRQRDSFNAIIAMPNGKWSSDAAELFYYLNRTGFNGLCRFNASGFYNVPMGKHKTINYRRDFSDYAVLLRDWVLSCGDFARVPLLPGDFVFIDPPYDCDFVNYSAGGFTWEDQVRAAEHFARHDGPVIATNEATARIVELYSALGFTIETASVKRSISANGDRTPALEMIAHKNLSKYIDAGGVKRLLTVSSTIPISSAVAVPIAVTVADEDALQPETENDDMANLPRDLAEQVGKARTAGGGNYMQHGNYIHMINRWFFQQIQDRCIILEMRVIEAEKKVVYEGATKVEQEPNAPGSECSTAANFDGDSKQSAPANSRAPVLGLFGYKEGDIPDQKAIETLDYVIDDKQPAAGMLIGCSTFPKEIRSRKGSYITGLNWSCVDKPGFGLNAPDKVRARLDAFKTSTDEGLRICREQLAAARAAGTGPTIADASAGMVPTAASTPAPQLPSAPPALPPIAAAPPIPVIDPFAGWTQHPENADYMYRGTELKKKAELLAAANRA